VCGSTARTDLYGGQLAIAVPTVTEVTTVADVRGYSAVMSERNILLRMVIWSMTYRRILVGDGL
jgi:hypothetical protein